MKASLVKQVIIGGIAFIVIGLALAFGPSMLAGFESTRNDTESYTQTTNLVTVSTNTSVVTLDRPLVAASSAYITSATSNVTADGLVKTVSVNSISFGNMDGSKTYRTITLTYDYGTAQYYTGLSTTIQMGPTLILLGFIILVGVVGFMGIKMSLR